MLPNSAKSKYLPLKGEGSQVNVELTKYAGEKLLLRTRASKLSPLKLLRLIKLEVQDGAGVFVAVFVEVGVRVMVGV